MYPSSIIFPATVFGKGAFFYIFLDANTRRLRPIRVASKTQTRGPLNFGPCKADWPATFVIK